MRWYDIKEDFIDGAIEISNQQHYMIVFDDNKVDVKTVQSYADQLSFIGLNVSFMPKSWVYKVGGIE